MSTIDLQQTDANANCGTTVACSGRSLSAGTPHANDCEIDGVPGITEKTITINGTETTVVSYSLSTAAIEKINWEGGTYQANLNITTAAGAGTVFVRLKEIYICRVNTSCVSQATLGSITGLSDSMNETGVISYDITGIEQIADVTDRLAIIFVFSNSDGIAHSFGVTPDQIISTPLTDLRTEARVKFGKYTAQFLELDLDICGNTYGVAPCTASGSPGDECYNTYDKCQDRPNYTKTTKTYKFCERGSQKPHGELIRPYITSVKTAPSTIDPDKGVATRSKAIIKLIDDAGADVNEDPYASTRAQAQGTFWGRFIARNPNYAGRWARVRKGYPQDPWDWRVFLDELYIIESIKGPKADGSVDIILKDPLKFADRQKIPTPTDGKLTHDFLAAEDLGTAQSGTTTTIKLRAEASALDDYYNGMNIYLTGGTGQDQERTITDYVGATRIATVAAWDVTPTSSSEYRIERISLTLDDAAEYRDPATTGDREFFAIGKEVIEYESLSGDVISWTSISKRAQFGTSKEDHKIDDSLQQCYSPIDQPVTTVLKTLINTAAVTDDYIDLVGLQKEEEDWLGNNYKITTCIPEPVDATELIEELCRHTNSVLWWCPSGQMFRYKIIGPRSPGSGNILLLSDDNIIKATVTRLDEKRITRSTMNFDMASVTEDHKKTFNYLTKIVYIDTDAEGENEYNEVRQDENHSRFLTENNKVAVVSWLSRRVGYRRDTQSKVVLIMDPFTYDFSVADLVDFSSNTMVDETGADKTTRLLVTSIDDKVDAVHVTGLTTIFGLNYGFIAPSGYPDHILATELQKQYAFISNASGLMNDGTEGYLIS